MNKAKKIEKAIRKIEEQQYLWAPYGDPVDGYAVNFGYEPASDDYYAFFMKEGLPAHRLEWFDTPQELAERVLRVQPDLRRWCKVSEE